MMRRGNIPPDTCSEFFSLTSATAFGGGRLKPRSYFFLIFGSAAGILKRSKNPPYGVFHPGKGLRAVKPNFHLR